MNSLTHKWSDRWYKYPDEKPNNSAKYLVCVKVGSKLEIQIEVFNVGSWESPSGDRSITHWCELPPFPEEE